MKKLLLLSLFAVTLASTTAMASEEFNMPVEEEISAVSISASTQGVRVLNANGATLEIYNIVGVKIGTFKIDSAEKTISINLQKGCYLFKVNGKVRKISIR